MISITVNLYYNFCRHRFKIEQNCRTLLLMLLQNNMQNLNEIITSRCDNDYHFSVGIYWYIKGVLSGLIQLLATEIPIKMMKNAFYFTLKTLFVFKVLKFLS